MSMQLNISTMTSQDKLLLAPRGEGGGVLPYMTYTGMFAGQGMVFGLLCVLCVCPKQGVYFVICPKQGPKLEGVVLHRVGILGNVLNRFRVSNPRRHSHTHTWKKCPTPVALTALRTAGWMCVLGLLDCIAHMHATKMPFHPLGSTPIHKEYALPGMCCRERYNF